MMRRKMILSLLLIILLWTADSLYSPPIRSVFQNKRNQRNLVIDAGHGGFDGGAQAEDGTSEQYINLQISENLHALCGLFGQSSVLTRSDENALGYVPGRTIRENKVADINTRKRIAEESPNNVFLSIHLNKFQEPQYFGAQVFYGSAHEDSRLYAESIQKYLITGLNNNNTRKAKTAPATVYLMQQLKCPALIVECGFLSNPEELILLQKPEYQKKLALCIFCGYLSAEQG